MRPPSPASALDAVDGDRGHHRQAAGDGVAHRVEDRPGMRGAAAEVGERQHPELRRAQRLARRHAGIGGAHRHARRRRHALALVDHLRRAAHQEGRRHEDHPGQDGDHELGGAPVVVGDQPAREGRDRHRRHAHAGRDQRHGKAAMLLEPAGHRRHRRHEHRTGGAAEQQAVDELELEQAGGAAGERDAQPQQDAAAQHDGQWPEAVGQRSPAEGGDAHHQEDDRHRRSICRCATSRWRPPSAAGTRPARTPSRSPLIPTGRRRRPTQP